MARGGGSVWAEQLCQLLGLDKETVTSQALPFLDSFDDRGALQSHLEGLLGTGNARMKTFISSFTESRFPTQSPAPLPIPRGSDKFGPNPAHGPSMRPGKGKKSLSARAGIGKPLPPRQIEEDSQRMQELSAAFGGMGTVYMKKRDDDDEVILGSRGKGKGPTSKGASPARTPVSETQTPAKLGPLEPQSLSSSLRQAARDARSVPAQPVEAAVTAASTPHPTPAGQTLKPPKPAESHPPTAEMLAIDAVIQELTSESDVGSAPKDKVHHKQCFCQGREHSLAPNVPICFSCGLVVCAALFPSPLSPLSSCPSCAASPLLSSSARADLVAKLAAEREDLVEQQRIHIEMMREQKRLNKEKRKEEQSMFPQLGEAGSSSSTSAAATPVASAVVGKHGGMARARTLAQDAQRTAKVLSLNMKTHKVTVPKKAKAKVKAVATDSSAVDGDAAKDGGGGAAKDAEAEEEEPEDIYTALDGSALVLDQDDGFAMHRPMAKAGGPSSMAASNGDAGASNSRARGAKGLGPRWSNRTIVDAQRLEGDDEEAGDAAAYIRYLSARGRLALCLDYGADEDEVEEDGGSVAGPAGTTAGQKGKAAEAASKKAVPGAAFPVAATDSSSRRRKKKGRQEGEA